MNRRTCFILLFMVCLIPVTGKTNNSGTFCKLKVASWNIGHFDLGQGDTRITMADYDEKSRAYRTFLNEINADIIALCEYSPLFVKPRDGQRGISAREAVLSNYTEVFVGPKANPNCNAVCSNGFDTVRTISKTFRKTIEARYYVCREFLIGGQTVKFVATHLDWDKGTNGRACRDEQIQELIETFKSDRYVILCADWNMKSSSEYDVFVHAGYTLANHGYLGDLQTWPAGSYTKAVGGIIPDETEYAVLDNIICKGFAVSGVHVRYRPDLSDHALIETSLTMLP